MIKDVAAWLKRSPTQKEIVEIQDGPNKVKIIPQKIIETLLDELTEQNWSTRNFQFQRWIDGSARTMCDASLELVVTYKMVVAVSPYEYKQTQAGKKEIEVTRVLVGAVSFDCAFFGNDHVANTAKSLCISNAASDLGKRFGKDLNPSVAPPINSLSPSGNKILQTLHKVNQ
jgi:hypothetical protein